MTGDVGQCHLTQLEDGQVGIIHADPRIRISGSAAEAAAACELPYAIITPARRRWPPHLVGCTLKIYGRNRTVIYVLREYDPVNDWYLAEWPD